MNPTSIARALVLLGLCGAATARAQNAAPDTPATPPAPAPADAKVPPSGAETAPAPPAETPAAPPAPVPAPPAAAPPDVAAAAPVTPKAEASSAADDAALMAQLNDIQAESEAPKGVQLSGFMDFNYRHVFKADPLLDRVDQNDSFFIGNANVYFKGNITRQLRSLLEVRFTYLPNGATTTGNDYYRTSTADYTQFDTSINLGGIFIERAYGEYEFDQRFMVRVGQYLTPYGIWNVDHGSPTVISIGIPYAIGQRLMPRSQTGVEMLGRFDVSDNVQLRYHLTLSNGRGPFDTHFDLDTNKAVGGRLQLVTQGSFGDFSVGASSYYGRYTDSLARDIQTGVAPIVSQYDELVFAGDVKWTFKGIHLQAEVVDQQVAYTDDGRRYLAPDSNNWGTYVIAGYRIPVAEVMPFFKFERQDDEYYDLLSYALGLNYRPFPELVLKASGTLIKRDFEAITGKATLFDTQIAWAF